MHTFPNLYTERPTKSSKHMQGGLPKSWQWLDEAPSAPKFIGLYIHKNMPLFN
jgi:hypothetical protein